MPVITNTTLSGTAGYTSVSTNINVSSGVIWNNWAFDSATTATASSNVWPKWVSSSTSTTAYVTIRDSSWIYWNGQIVSQRVELVESEEDKRTRQLRNETQRIQAEERRKAHETAHEKADALLRSILNDIQKRQLVDHNYFLVLGRSGNLYRIRRGRSANIDCLDASGNVIDRLCIHPIPYVPDGDTMVAQKLMIESSLQEEQALLRLSNRHGPRGLAVPAEVLQNFRQEVGA